MNCTNPLKVFFKLDSAGKKQLTFYNPNTFKLPFDSYPVENRLEIPCGQCISCRLNYSRNWAIRCMLEASTSKDCYFITLTYGDKLSDTARSNFSIDENTGDILDSFVSHTLVKRHLQLFIKRLRKYFSDHYNLDGIRFFACGEYGPSNMRPHYHLIVFNCPIPDLEFHHNNFRGDIFYSSKIIDDLWGYGFTTIGDCNYETCSYTARYIMKKQKGKGSKIYNELGIIPPFVVMSRRPGIAREWFDSHSEDIYSFDQLVLSRRDGKPIKARPPSYFDKLYDIDHHYELEEIKTKRRNHAMYSMDSVLAHTDLNKDEYLRVCDDIYISKSNKLVRTL